MRYRITINPMLDCALVVVQTVREHRGRVNAEQKLYTIPGEWFDDEGLVELLGELQRAVGESQG
jgi:hypothetical protein